MHALGVYIGVSVCVCVCVMMMIIQVVWCSEIMMGKKKKLHKVFIVYCKASTKYEWNCNEDLIQPKLVQSPKMPAIPIPKTVSVYISQCIYLSSLVCVCI